MPSNILKTVLLLAVLSALFLFYGYKWGGLLGLGLACVLVVVFNLIVYWCADHIILSLYRAQETVVEDYPALYGTVAYLVEKAELPMPRIYVIEDPMPNIFSTGRDPIHAAIIVTTGLLKLLSKDELAGVVAHELAHITHRDTLIATVTASIGGIINILINMAQYLVVFISGRGSQNKGRTILGALLMSILAPFLAILVQISIPRSREFVADESAADLCGESQWLADALRKLYQAKEHYVLHAADENPATAHLFIIDPLRSKQWSLLFSTHPSIAERIERLEEF